MASVVKRTVDPLTSILSSSMHFKRLASSSLSTIPARNASTNPRASPNYQHKPKTKKKLMTSTEKVAPENADWCSIYPVAQSYNAAAIPLPIRMGRPRFSRLGDIPPASIGNIELLKLPNFFHLTPLAIKRHCESLAKLCKPYPELLPNLPLRITTKNYIHAGPSLRHPDSKHVKLEVFLKDLHLDDHAYKKMILLSGDRYNSQSDEITITTDTCPTRSQNKEYAMYLLTALYHESWKTEPWELDAENHKPNLEEDLRDYPAGFHRPWQSVPRKPSNQRVIIGDKLIRFNKYGKPFIVEMRRQKIHGPPNSELHAKIEEVKKTMMF